MRFHLFQNKHSKTAEFLVRRVDQKLLDKYTHLFNYFVECQDQRPTGTWWMGLKSRGVFEAPDDDVIVVDYDDRHTTPALIAQRLHALGIEVVISSSSGADL
jgi:hypothetical protein